MKDLICLECGANDWQALYGDEWMPMFICRSCDSAMRVPAVRPFKVIYLTEEEKEGRRAASKKFDELVEKRVAA